MTAEPNRFSFDPGVRRDLAEKAVLAGQLAGGELEPAIDRALIRDPLHRAVQRAIDALRSRARVADLAAVAQELATDPAHRVIDVRAWLQALPAFDDSGDGSFRDDFAFMVALLKGVERRRAAGMIGVRDAATMQPQEIDWLWNGWLARGRLHLLAGDVGVGKTTLALSLAATISTGRQFPDGTLAQPGDVLFWNAEDDAATSLLPRFLAWGGDRQRLVFAKQVRTRPGKVVSFDPARDFAALATTMHERPELALLVIDPLVSAIAGDPDKNVATRRSLTALAELAAARNVAVLGIGHFGKTHRNRDPVLRVRGAAAFTQLARLVMVIEKGAGKTRLLLRAKSNLGPDDGGFVYTVAPEEIAPGVIRQQIRWGDSITGAAADLLREEDAIASPRMLAAQEWLVTQLGADGARVGELMAAASLAGHSWATVRRAKHILGAKSVALGDGWLWKMPRADTGPEKIN